jgi:hypothetical protein
MKDSFLNTYHAKQSARLVKAISEQPPTSHAQRILQAAKLAQNSRRGVKNATPTTAK